MLDRERSGFFHVEGIGECTKYIRLGYGVIVTEDALKVSILIAICEI